MKKYKIYNFISIAVGTVFVSLSVNLFFLKLKIAPGGVSGLATVIHYLTKVPIGTIVFVLNIPLFIIGIIAFGKKFGIKTFLTTLFMSLVLNYTEFLPQLTDDLFLASLFGGVLMGTGLALVFKGGATTGGTDIAAKVVNKLFPALNISEQLFFIDAMVVVIAIIAFRNFDIGFYSIISIWISSKVIDIVFEGVGYAKALFIISDAGDKIGEEILFSVKRGVTGFFGEGLYTKTNKKVLLTVVDRRKIPKIKRIVNKYDKNAFVIITEVREAMGNGFTEV